ncbi:MAG: siderophore-iron reductase FhuF [Duganella sp.]
MLALLQPIFQGDWQPYGATLACATAVPADAQLVSTLLSDEALLASLIRRQAQRLDTADLRVAASWWSNTYLEALLPPLAAAATLLHHRLPAAAADMALSLDDLGQPQLFHITSLGAALPGADVQQRYHPLLAAHLAPLFGRLAALSGVPQKILWGNASRFLDNLLREAASLPGAADRVAADRQGLLEQPCWPDGSRQPLYARARTVHVQGGSDAAGAGGGCVTLHRQCCLYYLLPAEGYCGRCPLDPRYRSLKAAVPDA